MSEKAFQNATQIPSPQTSNQNLCRTQIPNTVQKDVYQNSQTRPSSGNKIESVKNLPPKDTQLRNLKVGKVEYAPEDNMTQSRICQARNGLQLLKKKQSAKGLSREKPTGSYEKIGEAPVRRKNPQVSANQNHLKQEFAQEIPPSYNKKTESNDRKSPSIPVRKIQPVKSGMVVSKEKRQQYIPPSDPVRDDHYVNSAEEVGIQPKGDFMALLEAQMRKQSQMQNGGNKGGFGGNQNKNLQPNYSNEYDDGGELIQCRRGCGRMFNSMAIQKHEKICEKVFQSKRKAFNSAEFRQSEADGAILQKPLQGNKGAKRSTKQIQKQKPISTKAVPKWKLQSAQFRAGLKMGKGEQPTQEQKKMLQDLDTRVMCSFCGRKFAKESADRHIPFCEAKSKKIPKINTSKRKR